MNDGWKNLLFHQQKLKFASFRHAGLVRVNCCIDDDVYTEDNNVSVLQKCCGDTWVCASNTQQPQLN